MPTALSVLSAGMPSWKETRILRRFRLQGSLSGTLLPIVDSQLSLKLKPLAPQSESEIRIQNQNQKSPFQK
jgi:hypothetical protein